MENYNLEKDIKVFCITAKSFPEGVLEAHQSLHSLVPYSSDRKYFGISRPENGVIIYKSAAEELEKGELSKHGLEEFIIKKGNYISIVIKDFMKNIPAIGNTFKELTAHKGIDPNGYCIELYKNDDELRCMVKLAKNSN